MTTSLKEAKAARKQTATALNVAFLGQNFVALEQLNQDEALFESVLKAVSRLDRRIRQNPDKIPAITAGADLSLKALNEAISASKPQKEQVVKALSEVMGFYAALYQVANKRVNPFFLSEAVEKTVAYECVPPAIWENPQIQEEVRRLSPQDAAPFAIGVPPVKFPIALHETKVILSELKVDVEKLRDLGQAIEQLNGFVSKYPGLKTLAGAVSEMRKSMSNVVRNKGIIGGGNLEASKTIARANVLYDAMYEFFNQDLKVILGMEELSLAKSQPDAPVSQALGDQGARAAQKLFAARLEPDHFSGFLRFITGGAKPNINSVLKVSALASDLVGMTYKDLQSLSQEGQALVPASKVDQSTGPVIQQAAQQQPQQQTGAINPNNASKILQQLMQLAAGPDGKEKLWQVMSKYAPKAEETPGSIPAPPAV